MLMMLSETVMCVSERDRERETLTLLLLLIGFLVLWQCLSVL